MTLYAFILGRKQMLSVAEIINTIGNTAKIVDITPEALIAAFDAPLTDEQRALNGLGGTIKIVEIFTEESDRSQMAGIISEHLTEKFGNAESKILYAISVYSFSEKQDNILHKILTDIKRNLAESDIKSRYINKNFLNPETAAIKGENLIQKGAEIVVIQGRFKVFFGTTKAIQDIDAYTNRDYNRPFRDARLGMLPPKLAQIMINLSGKVSIAKNQTPDQHLYDPFVGLGTVLAEAMLMGFSTVGSDIDRQVIEKAQTNLDWIKNQTSNSITPAQTFRLFCRDATTLSAQDLPEKIDLVITESYLGPPVTRIPSTEEIKKTHTHIREIVTKFFANLRQILPIGTPIIICLPVYRSQSGYIRIDNLTDKISGYGFKAEPLISNKFAAKFGLKTQESPSLMYDRPDQLVGREIWKFVKQG
jgi:tRNA G10  N-methylase Trm11